MPSLRPPRPRRSSGGPRIVVLGEPVAWTLFAGTLLILLGIAVSEGRLPSVLGARQPARPAGHSDEV